MKMQMSLCLRVSLCVAALAHESRAQGFNIDMGPANHALPASTFRGAANQPGFWNSVDESSVPAFTRILRDVSGQLTNAHVAVSISSGSLTLGVIASGLTTDQAALFNDSLRWESGPPTATITVSLTGLAPGSYDVYCYCGDTFNEGSLFVQQCPSSPICTLFDGTFTQGSVFGSTCCSATAGVFTLTIGTCGSPLSYPAINALQIVPRAFSCGLVVTETFCASSSTASCICPCANCGTIGRGCESSYATGGALLSVSGVADVSSDSLVLQTAFLPSTAPVMFLQGTAAAGNGFGAPFEDGLLCLAGTITRLGVKFASGGTAAFGAGQGSDPLISVAGGVSPAGGTRFYQAWYRDAQVFCTSAGSNLSNGYRVVWQP